MQFETLALFRCTEKQYADSLCTTGNMKFNTPQYWIELEKKEGKGRGDSLEGVYAASHYLDVKTLIESNSLRENIQREANSNIIYFRSNDILNLPCFCLFGLNNIAFSEEKIDEKGIKRNISYVTKQYFYDFSNNSTKDSIETLPESRRPVLVLIRNPKLFIERVKTYFIDRGFKNEEILIQPVEYLNKKEPFISTRTFPNELFLKDITFSYQSEIRIVINTKNQTILQDMAQRDNIINIGNISDIASVEEFYYDDMYLELKGKILKYALPRPETFAIEDLPKEELLSLIHRIQNDDDIEFKNGNKERFLQFIRDVLKSKHNLEII